MNTTPKSSEHLSNCQVRPYVVSDPPKPRGTQQLQARLLTSLLNGCTASGHGKTQVQNEWCAVPLPFQRALKLASSGQAGCWAPRG